MPNMTFNSRMAAVRKYARTQEQAERANHQYSIHISYN